MTDQKIVPQREYLTLDDFIRSSNNFYGFFLDDCVWGKGKREGIACFKRFQEQNPEMEKEVTKATVHVIRETPTKDLPQEQLWEAYKIMSKLVFMDDEYVMKNGQPDDWYLCR